MKLKTLVLFVVLSLFLATGAQARAVKMIFWYPGEAGSTAEAQPILDEFMAYISQKISPDKIEGRYFNTVEGGLSYIKKEAPAVGILSNVVLKTESSKIGNPSELLATLPKPYGVAEEQYTLAGRENKFQAGTQIFSSEPFTAQFVNTNLFSEIPATATISATAQILAKLKDIAEGKIAAVAILTPTEAATLEKLTAPWAKSLVTISKSKPVPSARVVLFDPSWKESAKLKSALVAAGSDPAAREILDELRLVGFSEK